MNNIVIRAENLGKKYKIGLLKKRQNTLRDHVVEGVKSAINFRGRRSAAGAEAVAPMDTIWAVDDVSFEVKQGEVLGIIGRNGAGKSTLLKILSRITEPTHGRCEIYGRVGSLLEVGTGFHSELTGRENIYLNGAILGMKKAEIDRKFDEIVAFSEVEQFVDTPVKRYSSGMHMRLAFSVAAHLEMETLIIDEVLAVGDVSFQNKCLGKMGDVASQGRTVLFVSHNMGAVANLCQSVIWLDRGRVVERGEPGAIINAYLKNTTLDEEGSVRFGSRTGTGEARLLRASLMDSDGSPRETFSMGETVVAEMDIEFLRAFPLVYMSLDIKRADSGLGVLHLTTTDSGFNLEQITEGTHRLRVEIPNCTLYPGAYKIAVFIGIENIKALDFVQDAMTFSMIHSGCSKRTGRFYPHSGVFYLPSRWKRI